MGENIEMKKWDITKSDPQPPPEYSLYPMYPITGTNPSSPPPYSYNSTYNGAPDLFTTQPPTYVVTDQPCATPPNPPEVKDHLCGSITNMLLCNVFLGIMALVYSTKTRSSKKFGHAAAASRYSHTAHILNTIGFILGVTGHVIWISWFIYWAVKINRESGSDDFYHYSGYHKG